MTDSMFDWDAGNLPKIAAHGLTRAEAEQALGDLRARTRPAYDQGGEVRRAIVGATHGGRIIVVIFTLRAGRIRVVTAYPARPRDERAYWGQP